ncbi:uncharacterized protein N7477_007206 [Penicillium maclennaniae]|uniref:uncharacterized protein n=1 Tax=Penicillium maclennaniae TaxID=1343394 RepID=UPI002542290B|nr:uncharacterized protein N7477_007206 [Penicillium maclennaniae]KAJ5668636.1 hypothetical protein N7477_007206 [Penicillium maclennaniae]
MVGGLTEEDDGAGVPTPDPTEEHWDLGNIDTGRVSQTRRSSTLGPGRDEGITTSTQIRELGKRLADQLVKQHGCCSDCHEQAKRDHEEQHVEHWGLQHYLRQVQVGNPYPDVLSRDELTKRGDNLAGPTTAARKRQVYNGISPAHASTSSPLHICLASEDEPTGVPSVTFDIDSVVGFPTSLAVARQGIRWHPTQMAVSDVQSSLHLNSTPVSYYDADGRAHYIRRPIHQVPHYTFGRLAGFEDVSLCLLLPHLYRKEQQCSRLRDNDFRLWMDEILIPAISRHYPNSVLQHYRSSYDHSRSNATAQGVESRSQRVDPVAREQTLWYLLLPDALHEVWKTILERISRPGLHGFRDIRILLHAKNLKIMTKDDSWERMTQRFERNWTHAVVRSYTSGEFYFDIGKEVSLSHGG